MDLWCIGKVVKCNSNQNAFLDRNSISTFARYVTREIRRDICERRGKISQIWDICVLHIVDVSHAMYAVSSVMQLWQRDARLPISVTSILRNVIRSIYIYMWSGHGKCKKMYFRSKKRKWSLCMENGYSTSGPKMYLCEKQLRSDTSANSAKKSRWYRIQIW